MKLLVSLNMEHPLLENSGFPVRCAWMAPSTDRLQHLMFLSSESAHCARPTSKPERFRFTGRYSVTLTASAAWKSVRPDGFAVRYGCLSSSLKKVVGSRGP